MFVVTEQIAKEPKKKKQIREQPTGVRKAFLIAMTIFAMGSSTLLGYVVGTLMSLWFVQSCAADSIGCTSPSTVMHLYGFVSSIITSILVGVFLLRSVVRLRWVTSIASPLIAFAFMYSCGTVAMWVYGENFLGHPLLLTLLSFAVAFVFTSFLLEAIENWAAYPVALLFFAASAFGVPVVLGEIAQRIWVQNGITRAEKVSRLYPVYVPSGYELEDVRTYTIDGRNRYEQFYTTRDRFNPLAVDNWNYDSFTITGVALKEQDQTGSCDLLHWPGGASAAEMAEQNCEKISTTRNCEVARHATTYHREKVVHYYCVIDTIRFELSGYTGPDSEAVRIFDSMQLRE